MYVCVYVRMHVCMDGRYVKTPQEAKYHIYQSKLVGVTDDGMEGSALQSIVHHAILYAVQEVGR